MPPPAILATAHVFRESRPRASRRRVSRPRQAPLPRRAVIPAARASHTAPIPRRASTTLHHASATASALSHRGDLPRQALPSPPRQSRRAPSRHSWRLPFSLLETLPANLGAPSLARSVGPQARPPLRAASAPTHFPSSSRPTRQSASPRMAPSRVRPAAILASGCRTDPLSIGFQKPRPPIPSRL
jgi:hypothetical protein